MVSKNVQKIRKRDGRVVKFDPAKITDAIWKAAQAVGGKDMELAKALGKKVVKVANDRFDGHTIPTVEEIQDIVERVLISEGHATTAKAYILYREERKKLREVKALYGVEDDLKLTVNSIQVLEKRYLQKDDEGRVVETPGQLFRRVARAVAAADGNYKAKKEGIKKTEEEFYDLMTKLEFLPNSPTLMNAGTPIGQLSACFVLPVEDSMNSIFEAVKNTAIIHKSGGGTGFSFSKLRPKGDMVQSTSGVASGPISFMRVFDVATDVVKQGGRRRGANMAILSVVHPDIVEFIVAKEKNDVLNNFNISVALTDAFMKAVEKNEEYELLNPHGSKVVKRLPARSVMDLIVTMAWKNGDPGVVFIDRINEANPTPHVGMIEATNPCVAAGSLVTTPRGLVKIEDLAERAGGMVYTDNRVPMDVGGLLMQGGQGLSMSLAVDAWRSGEKETLKLTTESGYEVVATPEHTVMTTDGWVEMRELTPRHRVLIQSGRGRFSEGRRLPTNMGKHFIGENGRLYEYNIPDEWTRELGQILGWLVGDGWLRYGDKNCRLGFSFGQGDRRIFDYLAPLINHMYGREIRGVERENGVMHLSYHSKFFAGFFRELGVGAWQAGTKRVPDPIFTATEDAVIGFLQGLFSSDGTVGYTEGKTSCIRLTSKSEMLLRDVQLLLLNLGIKSVVYDRRRPARENLFKYRAKSGEARGYGSDGVCYELNISKEGVTAFLDCVGFLCGKNEEKISKLRGKGYREQLFDDRVASVEHNGVREVYDLTELKTHSFICNGVVVANCGEQPLLPYESCNLGSVNLTKVVTDGKIDWAKLRKIVRNAVHFLDNVIDINKFPLPEIKKMTQANRKIGLGVMGFADTLIMLGIPYNSGRAIEVAEKLMEFITDEGRKMSAELGKSRGSFKNFKGSLWDKRGHKSMRNATITTIAPTGTIGIIAGCSGGIEPLFAISYVRKTPQFELLEVNPVFERISKERGFYSDDLVKRVSRRGSIRDVAEIPEDVRKLFVTAHDICPEDHVRIQAAFQKFTDNAVSKTVNFPNYASPQDVERVYMLAYKLGCKGVTVYRDGSRDQQVLNIENAPEPPKPAPESCEESEECKTCQ